MSLAAVISVADGAWLGLVFLRRLSESTFRVEVDSGLARSGCATAGVSVRLDGQLVIVATRGYNEDMSQMKAVGIRELKNRLSEYLREVRAGTTVLVTDRGAVVAEIREPTASRASSLDLTAMDLWIDAGKIRAPLVAKVPVSPTKVGLPDGTAQSILDLERGT